MWLLRIILSFLIAVPVAAWGASAAGASAAGTLLPSMQEVQQAALRYAGFDPGEFDQMESRVRWAAALPRLQFGFDRDLKDVATLRTSDNVSLSGGDVTVGPQESSITQDFNSGTSLDVRVVWYLDELVYNEDLLDVKRERLRWNREMRELTDDVSRQYLKYREVSRLKKGTPDLEMEYLVSRLDALTGGWFSRQLPQRGDRKGFKVP